MMFVSLKPSGMSVNQMKLYKPECSNPCVNLLGCKLGQIQLQVHEMRQALGQVHLERRQLEHQRKTSEDMLDMKCIAQCVSSQELKVQELQEKYDRLEEDFKSKMLEVCALRCELEKQKGVAEAALQAQREMQQNFENSQKSSHKLDISEQELQLNMARQRFREAQDELEELRLTSQDQAYQLEEYRNKYLQAQQEVEELRSRIEAMEMDNIHIGEQINNEIQKAKMQFKERIKELAPLPSILKAMQIKLQEYQKGKLFVEHKLEESNQQLEDAKQQIMELEQKVQLLIMQQEGNETEQINSLQNMCNNLTDELNRVNACVSSYSKALEKSEKQLEQKTQEVVQVSAHLDTVREESARQVARSKDRVENVRRCLQSQITDLELQLAQSRAVASAALRDRNEIRQRMQYQINNLSENFDQAQMRIRTLHSHVNFLKRSYSNILTQNPLVMLT